MAERDKRFYWLKLKVNFMTSETVDFLMSQKDGANYVVLYQMLCLKTINTDGKLARTIGEVVIPFDEAKIQRDCKWFSIDTIRVAMQLYRKLGLVYEDVDGTLVISDHENLIGSECGSAERMRKMRNRDKLLALEDGNDASQCDTKSDGTCDKNVTIEIEYRDRVQSIENISNLNTKGSINTDNKHKDDSIFCSASDEAECRASALRVGEAWNQIGVSPVQKFKLNSQRGRMLKARLREFGEETIIQAMEKVKQSPFLLGQNDRGWVITFDWFLKPNNFQKVMEGQYDERPGRTERTGGQRKGQESSVDRLARLVREGAFDE